MSDTQGRRYLIHGWSTAPLNRRGTAWVEYAALWAKEKRIVRAMLPGESHVLPFRTVAGTIEYRVERTA